MPGTTKGQRQRREEGRGEEKWDGKKKGREKKRRRKANIKKKHKVRILKRRTKNNRILYLQDLTFGQE